MMVNYDSPIIQNMINTGQFGTQNPLNNNYSYNPYMEPQPQFIDNSYNNIIPIGQVGYNSNMYNQQQRPENNYIFAPVQPNYANPQYDYYDPYGFKGYNQQQPYGYGINYQNGYSYGYQNSYYNNYYGGYANPQLYQKQARDQQTLMKMKYQIAGACFGRQYTNQELENIVNPQYRMQRMSDEERSIVAEGKQMAYYASLIQQPPLETQAMRTARCIQDMQYNYHKEFDNHSLREFLSDDLWKLNREFWIAENIKSRGRDLSRTYSSDSYNELLNMHRSSNPYIDQLLDTSRYDNNLDDMEVGLPEILDARRRRQQIYEGKVPTFISSEESQRRRHEFTSQVLNQIYNKGGNR